MFDLIDRLIHIMVSTYTLGYFGILSPKTFRLAVKYSVFPIVIDNKSTQCYYRYSSCKKTKAYVNPNAIGLSNISVFTPKQALTALLHEIGHHIDLYKNDKACRSHRKSQEKRAWKNALKLANKYNFDIDKTMAIEWLGTYGAKSAHLENYE